MDDETQGVSQHEDEDGSDETSSKRTQTAGDDTPVTRKELRETIGQLISDFNRQNRGSAGSNNHNGGSGGLSRDDVVGILNERDKQARESSENAQLRNDLEELKKAASKRARKVFTPFGGWR